MDTTACADSPTARNLAATRDERPGRELVRDGRRPA
jgi:hypothetical protein